MPLINTIIGEEKTYFCSVCNGLKSVTHFCPICHERLEDQGRISDLFGDYSPYQEIDLNKRSDGWIDLKNHTCPHHLLCTNCGYHATEMIFEQDS